MPSRTELVAHGRDTESIASEIGADLVIFQTLPDLIASVRQFRPELTTFDCSVFTGEYITGGVDEAYLQELEDLRADNIKGKALHINSNVSVQESKGSAHINGNGKEGMEVNVAAGGPLSSADDTVGLHNSFNMG